VNGGSCASRWLSVVEKAFRSLVSLCSDSGQRESHTLFGVPTLGVDRTTERNHVLFRFPAISQFGYVPDDLLFVCPLFRGIFIPPENPNVWNAFAFEHKETSLLKSAHTISFALSI
jgi:hypothetical protein